MGRMIKATAVLRSQPVVIEEAMLKFNVNNHPIKVMGGVLPGAELNWVGIVGYNRNRTHLEQFMNEIFIEMMKRPVINPTTSQSSSRSTTNSTKRYCAGQYEGVGD